MNREGQHESQGVGDEQVKTCPSCGGTWPAERPRCLACGANLADLPARAAESTGEGALDWRWLDAVASASEEGSGEPLGGPEPKEALGCLARIFSSLG